MKPSVDMLAETTWARIERDVFAQLDALPTSRPTRLRWWWLAIPAAASALAVVLLLVLGRDAPTSRAELEWSRVATGSSSSSVTFDDAAIAIDADSAVVLERAGIRPIVWLERGAASFAVAPRFGREPFVVLAGETMVRVIGTRFRVAHVGERTDVAVEHGIVEVQFRGTITRLFAGQTWSSEPPRPAPPAIVPPLPIAPPPPAKPARNDQPTYEALARLEPSQPDDAMRGYLDLAHGTSRWAQLALYSAGRLAADRGDPRAVALLESYLRRFPSGANAADALYLLDRLKGVRR
jgi:hypothetical protein